jgi:MFS family permease
MKITNRMPKIFYGWYIVGASIIVNSYLALSIWQGFAVFFLQILKDFQVSRTTLSIVFSVRQVESGFLSPLVGFLIDRINAKKVILFGVIIAGLGLILTGISSNIWYFYLAFIIMSAGVSFASHGVSWSVVVARWFDRKRGRATSLAYMGGAIGGSGVIIIVKLLEVIGWRSSVIVLGIGLWLVCIPFTLLVRSRPEDYGLKPDGDEITQNKTAIAVSTGLIASLIASITIKDAIKSKYFWSLIAIFGVQQISLGGIHIHQIAYFEDMGFSKTQAASSIAIAFSVSAIGRLSVGILLDRTDWQRVFIAIICGQIVSLLILANISLYWHIILFSIIFGFNHGMMVPIRAIICGKLFGINNLGSIWGTIDGAVVFTGVAGPVYLGWTFDTFHTYIPAFYILSLVLFTAIPIVLLVFKKIQKITF